MEVIFPDGDRIHEDGWREDTLIYYVPRSDWGRAIGMKVFFPDVVHPVTIRFWEDHLKHLESLSDSHLALMLRRLAQTFHDPEYHWYQWETLSFELPDWLIARVGEGGILRAFEDAGWHFQSRDARRYKWKRDPPDGAV